MIQINGREIFQKERVDEVLSREPATGLNEAFGKLNADGWNQRSSYSGCNNGRVWEARAARLAYPDDSEVKSVVVWKPNQIFEKSEKKGRDPEREIAPSLL